MAFNRRYGNNTTTTSRNRLSDRDMIVDLINTEKHLSHLYEHAIMESSSSMVHNTMEEFQHDEHENAYTLYNVMQGRGWYNPAGAGQEQRHNFKKVMTTTKMNNNRHYNNYNGTSTKGKSYDNRYQFT
ncbi:spore coat protein [Sporomusa acidovorans]|uniref:Coat F domain protein n=1 Tax=Sporomusa acidovorans (strain ATCC 49682 / DSM 3132 / Mol) TaxID=1123286 RepID=A0ABZ3J357_SPOA4|nr:spore coat protein [Sporomusa acidovorans]OZC20177.1 coat F domain protein [Sporomusa acidovorans DSM 3132]SDD42927.1 Coat F domain-containing protein [Sporomusa acidovorans]